MERAQTSAETTRTTKRQDASLRFSEEYLNEWLPLSLEEFIKYEIALPPGRLTFSDGVLWYDYDSLRFHTDQLKAPRTFSVAGVKLQDADFFNHDWLVENYVHILRELKSFDPFHGRKDKSPAWSETVIFLNSPVGTCHIEVVNGWRLRLAINAMNATSTDALLGVLDLRSAAE